VAEVKSDAERGPSAAEAAKRLETERATQAAIRDAFKK